MQSRIASLLLVGSAVLGLFGGRAVRAEAEEAQAPPTGAIFCIGEIDASTAEFGLVKRTFWDYWKVYRDPVVFTIGKDESGAWPYIHPSNHDKWAGSKAHTFTIHFDAKKRQTDKKLVLSIGTAATFTPSEVTVSVNGHELPSQTFTKGSDAFAHRPLQERSVPDALLFEVSGGMVQDGKNTLTIKLEGGSWLIYDYVCLAPEPCEYKEPDILPAALAGPLADIEDIVFAMRKPGPDGHWYANFSYYAPDAERLTYRDGGRLCVLNIRSGKVTTLLNDPKGGIRDPQLHYDGKKILFSYRRDGGKHYKLYEINIDGTGLKQLTDGPYDDFEPTYMPDDSIVFCSSRCKRWVNCWLTQVAVLYRMNGDGTDIRPISSNNEHDNTPWPLPDGRILYQRWEYVDRSQVHYHHLWTANPDGTGQMVYYGNMRPGILMIDAKPIPGTNRIVSVFSPGHGRREHAGVITIVDPLAGPDNAGSAQTVNPSAGYRDPYAVSEDCFLVASDTAVELMDGRGRTKRIFILSDKDRDAEYQCHEPRPIMPRPRERIISARSQPEKTTGRLFLADVYKGRNMDGVKPGEIKKLLVLETLPKPVNFTGGMEPLSYGGTFTLERILGTVPVEPDGSASLEVPALRSLFFVALDENDMSVKRMQSFLTVQPGETMGCVGCHEQRTSTQLPAGNLMAMRRPPSIIEPIADMPEVFDFPRDIQPILDKHCLKCHDYDKRKGGVILTGDRGVLYSHSYFMLSARQQVADGRNRPVSNYPPRGIGSSASPLMKKVLEGHHGVEISEDERDMIRLWIDTGAPYPGTYAGLGTGMIGGYEQNQIDRSDTKWPSMIAAADVLEKNCAQCHKEGMKLPSSPSDNRGMPPWAINYTDPRLRFSRHILYNLSRPEKSLQLLAPLAKEAGGYGLCNPESPVFASTDASDYKALLAAIQDTARRLDEIKRFDMAGFRPRNGYIREMQRYGILPAKLDPIEPIDTYAADRAYWKSLWHNP